ncbi:hypothetical protein MAR_000108 [Mya arenaria]|uniref:Globin domain-containing protein n=1 Tax=Mya arenaria TaxID=6604 RepID=A0ABY7F821_MYAAR|nr:uncharacterized protein LOC128207490 [Mya arenaria]WAR18270.1 hypothetical protein MAR_000108 [Mya arenaria]
MGALKSKFRRSKSPSRRQKDDKQTSKKTKRAVNLPESQSARKTVDARLPFSNYRQIFSIRNAWKAIQRSLDECALETMIRLLKAHPEYKRRFPEVPQVDDEDEYRKSEAMQERSMDMYNLLDGLVTNLEAVDKALYEIQYDAPATNFTPRMLEDYREPFITTIRITLGSDRFTETTEENFKLLFGFVQQEMTKYLEEDEPIAIDETTPGTEAALDEAIPDDKAIAMDDATPIDEAAPLDEDPIEETAPVEKATPVDETALADEATSVDDVAPVDDTQVQVDICAENAT